mmetsp:Transcript_17366/g.23414  ORF Transcript_17366/g.23414 Transcript_17366/m.23414 type:complete len:421 (+) Transcript_17366:292-1554(+)
MRTLETTNIHALGKSCLHTPSSILVATKNSETKTKSFKRTQHITPMPLFCLLTCVRFTIPVGGNPLCVLEPAARPSFLEVCLCVEGVRIRQALLKLRLELLDQPLHWPCRRIAESADRVSLDLPRDFLEHGDLPDVSFPLLHLDEDVLKPAGAFTTRRTLTTRLVTIKMRQAPDRPDHIDRLVKDGDCRRAQGASVRFEVVKVHECLRALLEIHDGYRGPAWDDRLEIVPAAPDPTAVLFYKILQRDRHLLFHNDRVIHVTANAEELGSAVILTAHPPKPAGSTAENGGRHCNRLDVSHCRGTPKYPHIRRKGWLQPRFALLAFEGFNESSFFAADVSTRPSMQVQVKIVTATASIFPEITCSVGFVDRLVHDNGLVEVLSTNVDVGCPCTHRIPCKQASLHELVRILPHYLTVLTCSRF